MTTEVEWCECPGPKDTFSGLGLREALNGAGIPWVHSTCSCPTFLVWQKYEKFCWECGRSFSSPYIDYCEKCSPEQPWPGWTWAIIHDEHMKPWK